MHHLTPSTYRSINTHTTHTTATHTATVTSTYATATATSTYATPHAAEQSHAAWSAGATQYDTYFTRFFTSYATHALHHIHTRMSTSHTPLTHTSHILDVGAGTGACCVTAHKHGYRHIDAVDYAPEMIRELEKKRDAVSASVMSCRVVSYHVISCVRVCVCDACAYPFALPHPPFVQLHIPSSQLSCHVMDAAHLTFPDRTYDAVFAMFW